MDRVLAVRGLPVGLAAGATAFALVLVGLGTDVSPGTRRMALALGVAGVAFLAALAVAIAPLSVRASVALPASAAVTLLVAVGTYATGRTDGEPLAG